MEFTNALGQLILLLVVLVGMGYSFRRRGAIIKWLDNMHHEDNKNEKDVNLVDLRRRKEDIERDIARLEDND